MHICTGRITDDPASNPKEYQVIYLCLHRISSENCMLICFIGFQVTSSNCLGRDTRMTRARVHACIIPTALVVLARFYYFADCSCILQAHTVSSMSLSKSWRRSKYRRKKTFPARTPCAILTSPRWRSIGRTRSIPSYRLLKIGMGRALIRIGSLTRFWQCYGITINFLNSINCIGISWFCPFLKMRFR